MRARAESNCSDVMLGRPLLAKPDLANQIKSHINRTPFRPLGWEQVVAQIWNYHCATLPNYPSKHIGNRLKQWLMYLRSHYLEANNLFENVKTLRDEESIKRAFIPYLNSEQINFKSRNTLALQGYI
jgi:tRNA-dihydrouridine synthase C